MDTDAARAAVIGAPGVTPHSVVRDDVAIGTHDGASSPQLPNALRLFLGTGASHDSRVPSAAESATERPQSAMDCAAANVERSARRLTTHVQEVGSRGIARQAVGSDGVDDYDTNSSAHRDEEGISTTYYIFAAQDANGGPGRDDAVLVPTRAAAEPPAGRLSGFERPVFRVEGKGLRRREALLPTDEFLHDQSTASVLATL
ncbi:hypothetical protein EXIGLDRAFT_729690 [Exidia glandulosa HHB12029]|uniref:Uncharacterized protein n=1 Tax=Exidia glandulosa HHB12029 TaxID=1314781 RepID=A0A165CHH6_EXIGL|nr:hypothetical protein EXIGLDRAFT_729690 [Exidia glandulosa HHB12029]